MKNQRILFLVIPILFLSSCITSNVRFVTPQPESLKPLEIIPEKFQGTFVINKDTIVVTDCTVDGGTINSDSLIVKGWGNYLFVNQLDVTKGSDKALYLLACAKAVNVWNNEEISYSTPSIDIESQLDDFVLKTDTAGLSDDELNLLFEQYIISNPPNNNFVGLTEDLDYILDNVSLNEFQTMLNKSAQNSTKVTRIK
jgi:hypothetical protein